LVCLLILWIRVAAAVDSDTLGIYVNECFEIRDHDAPTKYVFNGSTRVARSTGSVSSNLRLQRLRLCHGWNLCSLAVTATNAASQLSKGDSRPIVEALYKWVPGKSNYAAVSTNETLCAGTVLWVRASSDSILTVIGTYAEPRNPAVIDGTFVPSAGLKAWFLADGILTN